MNDRWQEWHDLAIARLNSDWPKQNATVVICATVIACTASLGQGLFECTDRIVAAINKRKETRLEVTGG